MEDQGNVINKLNINYVKRDKHKKQVEQYEELKRKFVELENEFFTEKASNSKLIKDLVKV